MKDLRKTKIKREAISKVKMLILTALSTFLFSPSVYASNKIMESSIFKSTMQLFNDATTALLWAVPSVAIICIIFFSFRKGHSTEQHDIEKWQKAITRTIISAIIALSASALLAILTAYFGGSASA